MTSSKTTACVYKRILWEVLSERVRGLDMLPLEAVRALQGDKVSPTAQDTYDPFCRWHIEFEYDEARLLQRRNIHVLEIPLRGFELGATAARLRSEEEPRFELGSRIGPLLAVDDGGDFWCVRNAFVMSQTVQDALGSANTSRRPNLIVTLATVALKELSFVSYKDVYFTFHPFESRKEVVLAPWYLDKDYDYKQALKRYGFDQGTPAHIVIDRLREDQKDKEADRVSKRHRM